jgi:hypothetical protein
MGEMLECPKRGVTECKGTKGKGPKTTNIPRIDPSSHSSRIQVLANWQLSMERIVLQWSNKMSLSRASTSAITARFFCIKNVEPSITCFSAMTNCRQLNGTVSKTCNFQPKQTDLISILFTYLFSFLIFTSFFYHTDFFPGVLFRLSNIEKE